MYLINYLLKDQGSGTLSSKFGVPTVEVLYSTSSSKASIFYANNPNSPNSM